MKIVKLETFLTNAGLRNYLFVRLTTDTGLTGLGEASLEWQEKTVETLIHEWVEDRILGVDPRDRRTNHRRVDPRSIPGRIDRADGHQRHGSGSLGHSGQGVRAAGLSIARGTGTRAIAIVCQRLVWQRPDAGRVCRARSARWSPAATGR